MKNLIIAGLVACAIALSGCVSVEGTKAQLASGDPAQIAKAEANLIKIIGNGDQSRNGDRSYSTEERLKFVEIVPNNDVIMAAAEIALTDFHNYSSDKKIVNAALQKMKFDKKEEAAKFALWTIDWDVYAEETSDVFARAFALLDEQATIKVITDYASTVKGFSMRDRSRSGYHFMPNSFKSAPDDHVERRMQQVLKFLTPGLESLKERSYMAECLAECFNAEKSNAVSSYFSASRQQLLLHLVNVAQSPDLLCKILMNKIIWGRNGGFNQEEVSIREAVEARLLSKAGELSDPLLIEKLMECRNKHRDRNIKDKRLELQLVMHLPKDKQEKMALEYIKEIWHNHWTEIDTGKYEVAIIAASATKDPAVKIKVADAMFKEIFHVMAAKKEWNNLLHQWDKKDREMADKIVARLVKMAGVEWFASSIVSLEQAPQFVTKHITPEVAALAFEKGRIKSLKLEDALAQIVPAEKITMENYFSLSSGNARKTLAGKMPKSVKDSVAAAIAERAARILQDAKSKEHETFVLGGFYLGMPIDDARIMLEHQFPDIVVSEARDDKNYILEFPGQSMPFCYAGKTGRIYELNFGKKLLKKWYQYDVQTYREWARVYSRENKIDMNYKAIEKETTVYEPDMSNSYRVFFHQESYQYKYNNKNYRLTYFGEEKDFTAQGGLSGFMIKGMAEPRFRYVRGDPGSLRAEIEND